MGLRSRIRNWLVAHGHRVPGPLVRPHDRLFHATVHKARPGMVVVDIGAHRGSVAAAFAARGATVYAFEPNPDVFPALEATAERYPGIWPQACGVLDRDAEMKLFLHRDYDDDPAGHSESSSLIGEKEGLSPDRYRIVPVRDIAAVIEGIARPIDIMKIDAEGAEYRILRRMIESGTIDRVAEVYVETHHDRVPALRPEYEAVAAALRAKGLAGRVRFDWA